MFIVVVRCKRFYKKLSAFQPQPPYTCKSALTKTLNIKPHFNKTCCKSKLNSICFRTKNKK